MFLVTAHINFCSLEIIIGHLHISARSMRSAACCACAHLIKAHEGSQQGDLECF